MNTSQRPRTSNKHITFTQKKSSKNLTSEYTTESISNLDEAKNVNEKPGAVTCWRRVHD